MKFNIKAFALTCAIFWGVMLFLITWWIIIIDGSSSQLTFIGRVYIGYTVTPLGSLIGMLWGFVDGLIGGAFFAWLYNLLNRKKNPEIA